METFSALLAICAGNSLVPGEFPAQRPVTRNFDVFFDLRLNKRLSKQWWGWWFETLSHSLWRHRNDDFQLPYGISSKGPECWQWKQLHQGVHFFIGNIKLYYQYAIISAIYDVWVSYIEIQMNIKIYSAIDRHINTSKHNNILHMSWNKRCLTACVQFLNISRLTQCLCAKLENTPSIDILFFMG